MALADLIQKGKAQKPPRVLMHGGEGIGKTTWAASAPKPVFIQTEDGLDEIDAAKFPLAKTVDDVGNQLEMLRTDDHDYLSVAIDSADWLERIIHDEICRRSGVETIEAACGGYGKGYTAALAIWREIVAKLDQLRNERGMIVILISHTKVERFEDPESAAYDRYSPRLHKASSALLCEWCDAILFATRRFRIEKEKSGFNKTRATAVAIGSDGGERVIRPYGGPTCVAKNRYGLTSEIPLSWTAFVDAIAAKNS